MIFIDIFLSINNREYVLKLPVLPSEINVETGYKNETYETVKDGDIKLIGLPELDKISITSFFPDLDKEYTFVLNTAHSGIEYVKIIEEWKARRIPIRIVIAELDVNMAVTIDKFTYGADRSTDIPYTLELSEFKFLKFIVTKTGAKKVVPSKQVKTQPKKSTAKKEPPKKRPPRQPYKKPPKKR